MKVSVDFELLRDQVMFVSANVPLRTPNPLLNAIKVGAKDGTLTMEATDDIAYVRMAIDAEVNHPGEVFVDGALLKDSITSLVGGNEVSLSAKKRLTITRGGRRRSLSSMQGEFPEEPKPKFVVEWDQAVASFLHKANLTVFAVAEDVTRPELMGICFNLKDQLVVGGDGRRMAFLDNPLEDAGSGLQVIFHPRFFQEVNRSGMGGTISVSISDTWIRALSEDGRTVVWAKAMNRSYPTEASVLASRLREEPGVDLEIDRVELLNSLGLASVYTDKARQVQEPGEMYLVSQKGKIRAEMTIPGIAEMKDILSGTASGDIILKLEPQLLRQAVGVTDAETVHIRAAGEGKPILLTDPNNLSWGYVQTQMVQRDTNPVQEFVENSQEFVEKHSEPKPEAVFPEEEEEEGWGVKGDF